MKRNRNIVVKSQFNIGGSRGKSVKPFITQYVSREAATSPSMAYQTYTGLSPSIGDGNAFTLDATSISRDHVLHIAEHVESQFLKGNRAIQQLVVSFAPDYLMQQALVTNDPIAKKGDYMYRYDEVRMRHAIRSGTQALIDASGYRDGKMIGCLQHDTLHLHAHLVIYEDHDKLARMRGRQEKGMITPTAMAEMTHEVDRSLSLTKGASACCEKTLLVKQSKSVETPRVEVVSYDWHYFLSLLQLYQDQQDALKRLQESFDDWFEKDDDNIEESFDRLLQ